MNPKYFLIYKTNRKLRIIKLNISSDSDFYVGWHVIVFSTKYIQMRELTSPGYKIPMLFCLEKFKFIFFFDLKMYSDTLISSTIRMNQQKTLFLL